MNLSSYCGRDQKHCSPPLGGHVSAMMTSFATLPVELQTLIVQYAIPQESSRWNIKSEDFWNGSTTTPITAIRTLVIAVPSASDIVRRVIAQRRMELLAEPDYFYKKIRIYIRLDRLSGEIERFQGRLSLRATE